MAETAPVPIDYTSRDYAAIRSDLIAAIPDWLPEWTNRTESDFGIVLIEMFAYVGDILGYYTDRVANEAFIGTAVQRSSVLSLASMIDYRPAGRAAANVTLSFTISSAVGAPVTIPAGTQVSTLPSAAEDPVVFETDEAITIGIGTTDTVTATEGTTMTEDGAAPVGISDGAPDQYFGLYYPDIIEDSLVVSVDEDGVGAGLAAVWRYVPHLIDATSEDRVYTTLTDENNITYIQFGDDVNGRVPTAGAVVTATYRVGQGVVGNVGSGTLVEMVTPVVGVASVINPGAATGGADEESIESIRRQAPRSLTVLERAVTTDDYAYLAEKVPGVLHAKATASVYTNVQLAIAPVGGGAPSTALKNSVLNDLSTKKMIGTSLTAIDPTYVAINVTVNPLNVLPQYNRQTVETAVANAVTNVFAIENVDFGYRVTLSQIYRAIQEVEGVDYAVVTVLSTTGSGLADVTVADDEIPTDGTISITSTGGLIGS
jgi:uncharacterized phage protein gp47/JayE